MEEDRSDEGGKRERTLLCGVGRLELVEVVQYVGMIINGGREFRIEKEVRNRIRKAARVIVGPVE